jgi:hypothetical protein
MFWAIIFLVYVLFILHCPIFKPWFGFRKPDGHRGRWFE